MGYNKFIVAGTSLELYEYEKDFTVFKKARRRAPISPKVQNLPLGGGDTLQAELPLKRRDNARRASMDFRRLVASNLVGNDRPLLFTLTWAENLTDLRGAYAHFTSFIEALRFRYGKGFRYVAVPEFQKRGAVHFHALFWGLPSSLVLRERESREIAGIWKVGFVYLKETDGNERLSSYLSKYMAKAFMDSRLRNQKAFVGSRNLLKPRVEKGFGPIHHILRDWVGDNPPLRDKSFMTQWLGKGRYRLYQINP